MYYNYNRSIPKPFQEGLHIQSKSEAEPVTMEASAKKPMPEVPLTQEALPKEVLPKEVLPKSEISIAENCCPTQSIAGNCNTAILVLLLLGCLSS